MILCSHTRRCLLIHPNYRIDYNTEQADTNRATIKMVHANVHLTVSQSEASKVEEEAKRRLLSSKKLSLVVDLDQTIIHATVDPTVAEWKKDTDNPNHNAVKDVRAFQLVDDGPGAKGCWYYIKLRPGLNEFLENVSKIYELHIYTMGTRAYAQNIANIIDPERKIFGDRILSRDESGSLVAKNLQRLFPVDTKMVVIIDDRGDVWQWNNNLIKVSPYDFFVGIGDINSSFLPKKPELKTSPKPMPVAVPDAQDLTEATPANEAEPKTNGSAKDHADPLSPNRPEESTSVTVTALEQLVSMGGGDDLAVLEVQTSHQDELIAAQLQDRPLLQRQLKLEAEDAALGSSPVNETELSTTTTSDGSISSDSGKSRHNLLQDHDRELFNLEQSLRRVHTEFFDAYTRKLAAATGGRLAELRGDQKSHKRKVPANDSIDFDMVPDVKIIMPQIKHRVLKGVVIVFSGVVPIGTDIQNCDIALWAKTFGARVEEHVGRRTTHVIAARNRTAKVRTAAKKGKGRIKVVGPQWLMDSISAWRHVDEQTYLLNVDEGDTGSGKSGDGEDDEVLSESEDVASGVETEDDDMTLQNAQIKSKHTLTIDTSQETDDENDADLLLPIDDDNTSPIGGNDDDWKRMHDEVNDFLGSDDDDSDGDGDSVTSDDSQRSEASETASKSKRGKKRNREEITSDAEDGSQLQGRKKLAFSRPTNLNQTEATGAGGTSGLPTPEPTTAEEGENGGAAEDDNEDEDGKATDGDGWNDFEDDLEAEMQKAGELEAEMQMAASEDRGEG